MNDLLTKILLEKEEKIFKSLEEKKKNVQRKQILDGFGRELDENIKRDAMSHYQEDKTHHKRPSNYTGYQWDYLNQQNVRAPNTHNHRGPFPYGGSSQAHSMGWRPIGMPRQTNPYYSNPHGHMMPPYAHSEYHYNQWNNPTQKNAHIHNAHSQNVILPQSQTETKHHSDISGATADFGMPSGHSGKMHNISRDMKIRPPSSDIHSDHLASMTSAMRNSQLRASNLSSPHKPIINNPLSDLQTLVTKQENIGYSSKPELYQQESVDLSAHSDTFKHKENLKLEQKTMSEDIKNKEKSIHSTDILESPNKEDISDSSEVSEKAVKVSSVVSEKNTKVEISSSDKSNNLVILNSSSVHVEYNENYTREKKVIESVNSVEEQPKVNVVDQKIKNSLVHVRNGKESTPLEFENCKNDLGAITQAKNEIRKSVNNSSITSEFKKNNEDCDMIMPSIDADQKVSKDTESAEVLEKSDDKFNKTLTAIQNGKRKAEDEQLGSENKKVCLENESHVEKAVVDNEENSDMPTVSSTSTEVKPPLNDSIKKTPKKKLNRKSRTFRLPSGQSSSSEGQLLNKKVKTLKEDNKKKIKKNLCDVVERRGPFIHIEGSKECPSSVTVINFPKADDEDEKDRNFVKKLTSSTVRTKHHNELDCRGKSKNGLFSSTLSSRYDSHTTDHTWVCVFCKMGPHYNTLGDLFGPYIISKGESSSTCDFSGDEKDIVDAQKRGGRNKKSLRANNMVEHFQKMSKKLRKSQSNETCLVGMTVISDDRVDQVRYEVWVHEPCAVWSPNVCLIGSRIVGMQEAIWSSVKTMCSKCGNFGANIGCVFRNCPNRSHYHCANENGWSLEQETFISTCHIHKPRS